MHKDLNGGGFASVEQIEVAGPRGSFKTVRILGPCRSRSQIELSKTDARTIGVDAPVRLSGDVEGSAPVRLVGPAGELELKEGAIVAKRHVHIGRKESAEWGYKTGDVVSVRIDTPDRSLVFGDTEIRVQSEHESFAVMHIDTDEANAAGMTGPQSGFIVSI